MSYLLVMEKPPGIIKDNSAMNRYLDWHLYHREGFLCHMNTEPHNIIIGKIEILQNNNTVFILLGVENRQILD